MSGTVLPSLLVSDRCQTGSGVHKGLKIQHKKFRHSRNELRQISYVNINGYGSKADNLKQIIEEVKSAIILLCETKVYKNSSIKIEGYQVFSAVRQTKQGGGLAFAVRNKYCQSLMIDKGDSAEFLNIRMTMKGNSIRLILVYGPQVYDPKEVIDEFYQNVMIHTERALGSGDSVCLIGDLNAKLGNEIILSDIHEINPHGKILRDLVW